VHLFLTQTPLQCLIDPKIITLTPYVVVHVHRIFYYVLQGVVSGVLLVTPNAVMFDPNVSDSLVMEHGADTYGVIAPMDMIISCAMYHDIVAMNMRKKHKFVYIYN